jgi:hypothetical protein
MPAPTQRELHWQCAKEHFRARRFRLAFHELVKAAFPSLRLPL